MVVRLLAAFLAAVLCIPASASAGDRLRHTVSKTERRYAGTMAEAVLRAYKARDLSGLSALSCKHTRRLLAEIAERGESHPRYRSMFTGWRWAAVEAWKGKLGETRYVGGSPPSRARVVFGKTGDRLAVVTLRWEGGMWAFDDINSPSEEGFHNWGRP